MSALGYLIRLTQFSNCFLRRKLNTLWKFGFRKGCKSGTKFRFYIYNIKSRPTNPFFVCKNRKTIKLDILYLSNKKHSCKFQRERKNRCEKKVQTPKFSPAGGFGSSYDSFDREKSKTSDAWRGRTNSFVYWKSCFG